MSTDFPNSIDTFTTKTVSDFHTATYQNNVEDAIEAIEGYIGVSGSGVTGSLSYKVTQLTTSGTNQDSAHTHNHDVLEGYVADEHIDWTSATSNLSTAGTVTCDLTTVTGTTGIQQNSYQSFWAFRYKSGLGVDNTGLYFDKDTFDISYKVLNTTVFAVNIISKDVHCYRDLEIDRNLQVDGNATIGDGDAEPTLSFHGTNTTAGIRWIDASNYFNYTQDVLWTGPAKTYYRLTSNYIYSDQYQNLNIGSAQSIKLEANTDVFGDFSTTGNLTISGTNLSGVDAGTLTDGSNADALHIHKPRAVLCYSRNTTISADADIVQGGPGGANRGDVMPRSGSIVGISTNLRITAKSSDGDLHAQVLINNVAVYQITLNITATGNNYEYATQAAGITTFSAGDRMQFRVDFDGFEGSVNYPQLLVEVEYDS